MMGTPAPQWLLIQNVLFAAFRQTMGHHSPVLGTSMLLKLEKGVQQFGDTFYSILSPL